MKNNRAVLVIELVCQGSACPNADIDDWWRPGSSCATTHILWTYARSGPRWG